MSHSCVEIYCHIIFSTKDRLPLIPPDMEKRLYPYIGGIARKRKVPILKINGVSDHVHILLKLHSDISLSNMMREIKSYSTGWLKKENVKNFAWQEGYGAFSCSITHIDALIKYIDNQKEHHKTSTFDNELDKLNQIWGVKWMKDESS